MYAHIVTEAVKNLKKKKDVELSSFCKKILN